MRLLTEVLDVMTDGFHKSGLKAQMKIFYILIHILTTDIVHLSLTQVIGSIANDKPNNMGNAEYLFNFLSEKLSQNFPNVPKTKTVEKVTNWFQMKQQSAFEDEVEDYLILINRFSASEVAENK